MRLEGTIEQDGKFWLASVPAIEVDTQGTSVADARVMMKDAIESLDEDGKVRVTVAGTGKSFFVAPEPGCFAPWMAFVLRRLRENSGKSLEDVRKAIGANSRNAYARYESGAVVPSVEKFGEMVEAMSDYVTVLIAKTGKVVRMPRDKIVVVGEKRHTAHKQAVKVAKPRVSYGAMASKSKSASSRAKK